MFHAFFFVSCLLLALFRWALVPFGRGDRDVFSCTGFIRFDMPARNGMVERFVSVCRASDAGTERKRTVKECRRQMHVRFLGVFPCPYRLRLAGMRPRGKRNCRSRRDGSPRAVPEGDFIMQDERTGHAEPSFASDLCGGQEGIRGVCVFPTRSAGDASPFRSETKENRSGKRSGLRTTILPGISVGNYSVMTEISSAGAAA